MRVSWCDDAVYELAARFRNDCLHNDGSLFTSDSDMWTAENVEAVQAVVGQEDLSDRPFMVKLVDQVSGLTPPQILVAAELLLVQLLGESDTGAETKLQHIDELLALVPGEVVLPQDVQAAIDGGG